MRKTPENSIPDKRRLVESYGKAFLPAFFVLLLLCTRSHAGQWPTQTELYFVENWGQIIDDKGKLCPDIRYTAEAGGQEIYLRSDGISFIAAKFAQTPAVSPKRERVLSKHINDLSIPVVQERYRVDMQFLGCNPKTQITAESLVVAYNNYYLAHCPDGILNVPVVNAVRYRELYPHIDLLVHSRNNYLKYDFIVRPGGNPADIRLKVIAADSVSLLPDGSFSATHALGSITKDKPYSFQYLRGDTIEVRSNYTVRGDTITFNIGSYDTKRSLIIDPITRFWGTYYGGTAGDAGTSVLTDRAGNIFLVGVTSSLTAISTPGSFQPDYGGGTGNSIRDIFVAKFDPAGRRLWATYFGGGNDDLGYGVTLDLQGNVIVVGPSRSSNLATPGVHQTMNNGGYDGLIVKIHSNGNRVWSTYYGGPDRDILNGVACDETGSIYVCGYTDSRSEIATAGAHQFTMRGLEDGFIARFSSSGARVWGTYYGGTSGEEAVCITSAQGKIFVGGNTRSSAGIATGGAYQTTMTGESNGFLACFAPEGNRLWGTYYGGDRISSVNAVVGDDNGDVIAVGHTSSRQTPTAIATAGAYQETNAGGIDGFAVRFTATGARMWATYYGGIDDDYMVAAAFDTRRNLLLAGGTTSPDGIVSADAHQSALGGPFFSDGFIVKLSTTGTRQWGTYYGGEGLDNISSLACDNGDAVIVCGTTHSTTAIASPAAHQINSAGMTTNTLSDAFMAKLVDGCYILLSKTPDIELCAGKSVAMQNIAWAAEGLSYSWSPAAGLSSTTVLNPVIQSTASTVYTLTITSTSGCVRVDSVNVTVLKPPVVSAGNDVEICSGQSAQLTAAHDQGTPPYTYLWSPAPHIDNQTIQTPTVNPKITTRYIVAVSDGKGCVGWDTVEVKVRAGLSSSSSTIDFGRLDACKADTTVEITLTNNSDADIAISAGTVSSSDFILLEPIGDVVVSANQSITIRVRFAPLASGSTTSTLSFKENFCNSTYTFQLKGSRHLFAYDAPQTEIDFGSIPVCVTQANVRIYTVRNTGTDTLYLDCEHTLVSLPFSIQPATSVSVPPGQDRQIAVLFTSPGTQSAHNEQIRIPISCGSCRDTLSITAKASVVAPAIDITPDKIVFPALLGCEVFRDTVVSVTNTSEVPVTIASVGPSPLLTTVTPLPITIAPGETQTITVRLIPQANGLIATDMVLVGEPCTVTASVRVEGNKQGVTFVVPDTIDVGEIVWCREKTLSATFSVENRSDNISGEITDVQVSGPFSTDLQMGTTLNPDVPISATLMLIVDSLSPDGEYTGFIDIAFDPCGITKRIVLKARKTSPFLSGPGVHDFGVLPISQSTTADMRFMNSGTSLLHIESVSVSAPFVVEMTTPALPVDLEPGQELIITVRYSAVVGVSEEKLLLAISQPCSNSVESIVRGRGDTQPQPGMAVTALDFGTVVLSSSSSATLAVTNIGNRAINLQSIEWIINDDNAFSSQFQPQSLPVGESRAVDVQFSPTASLGIKHGLLRIYGDLDTADVAMQGQVVFSGIPTIRIPAVVALPGQVVEIPLVLEGVSLPASIRQYIGQISFDYTLLEPLDYSYTRSGFTGTITFDGERSTNDTLAQLRFLALLGSSESTPLTWESFTWKEGNVQVRLEPGLFSLIDTCAADDRTVLIGGQPGIRLISPNPVNSSAMITCDLIEDGEIRLFLANTLGEVIREITAGYKMSGSYVLLFSADAEADGRYYLVLQTRTQTFVRPLYILR